MGSLIAAFGLLSAAGQETDFCQKTSQDLLVACADHAEGDYSVALAKCDNVSDPTARVACRRQAVAGLNEGRKTCREQFDARQAVCQKLGPAPYVPGIDSNNFIREVNNPYFPLPPGRTLIYEGQTEEGFVHSEFIITRKTKVIQGVKCTQVHDLGYLDGQLAEDTLDWFAQDKQGNVW